MYLQVIDFPLGKPVLRILNAERAECLIILLCHVPRRCGYLLGASFIPDSVTCWCRVHDALQESTQGPRHPLSEMKILLCEGWSICPRKLPMFESDPQKPVAIFVEIMQNYQAPWNPWGSFSKVFERAQLHVQWGLFTILCPLDLLKLSRPPSPITPAYPSTCASRGGTATCQGEARLLSPRLLINGRGTLW